MKLMAGLVPDGGRGLALPWLRDTLPFGLSPFSQASTPDGGKSRKPQTPSPRPITRYPRGPLPSGSDAPGSPLADNLSQSLTWSLTLDEGSQMRYLAMRGPHGRALSVLVATRPIRHLAVLRVLAMLARSDRAEILILRH
jgi:hypothetical protein